MLTHLTTEWDKKTYYVTADTLLKLADRIVNAVPAKTPAAGNGTFAAPWVLDGDPKTWLGLAKSLKMKDENYFNICGRYVKKHANGYYMSDEGGVHADPQKTASKPWGGAKGPSYPEYAKHYQAQGKGNVDWSKDEVAKLRKVLMADPVQAAIEATSPNPRPVLAATLMLAEAARNPRSFVVNMMLLDLIEYKLGYGKIADPQYAPDGDGAPVKNQKFYTLEKALWHPDVLAKLKNVSKPQKGSSGKGLKGIVDITTVKDLHNTGGKLPAAMTGSGYSMVRDNIMPGQIYTQAKEATLLIRWICQIWRFNFLRKGGLTPTMIEVLYQHVAPDLSATFDAKDKLPAIKSKFLQQLGAFIKIRADSFAH